MSQSVPRARHFDPPFDVVLLLACLAIVVLAAIMQIRDQNRVVLAGYMLPELCGWRLLLGYRCLGCGLTRSFISLAHGHIWQSLQYHPLGLLLFGLVASQVPLRSWRLWQWWRSRGLPQPLALAPANPFREEVQP